MCKTIKLQELIVIKFEKKNNEVNTAKSVEGEKR